MSSLKTLTDIFAAAPTLANAKKVVAKHTHHPMAICTLLPESIAHVNEAISVVQLDWVARTLHPVTPLAAATTCKLAEAADRLAK